MEPESILSERNITFSPPPFHLTRLHAGLLKSFIHRPSARMGSSTLSRKIVSSSLKNKLKYIPVGFFCLFR